MDDNKYDLTAGALGYGWGNKKVVEEILEYGNRGNVIERYKAREDIKKENVTYPIEVTVNKKVLKKAKKVLKKYADGDWRKAIKEEVNKDSVVCLVQGPYLCKKGENKYIDTKKFKGEVAKALRKYSMYDVVGKMKKQPTSYIDVKSKVINDYTQQAEKLWIESLRKKYQDRVIIYQEVLETLK